MAVYPKKLHSCDGEADAYGNGEMNGKPRRRAVRLVDELDGTGESTAERELSIDKSTAFSPRERRSTSVSARLVSTDGYAILSIHPEGEGETVAVVLSVPPYGEGEMLSANERGQTARQRSERIKVHLLVEQYAEMSLRAGEITPEKAHELMQAGKLCAAIRRGMSLLAYGDQSVRRLAYKLTAKGVDRGTAEEAAAYLAEKGYIHEDDTAVRRAEQDVRKLWGARRIRQDLRAQGFSGDAIEDAMETLAEVDFAENCATVIRKKYRTLPDDRAARQKMTAALMRLGYDTDVIREAKRTVAQEDGE